MKSLTPLITADLVYIRSGDLELKGLVFPHCLTLWSHPLSYIPIITNLLDPSEAGLQRKVSLFSNNMLEAEYNSIKHFIHEGQSQFHSLEKN